MYTQLKKWNAARRLRSAYIAYINHLDGYDCGTEMALQFRSTQNLRQTVLTRHAKLKSLDPELPTLSV